MRRGTTAQVDEYIEVRMEQLRIERDKNKDNHTHLILDKAIYELTLVLDLYKRNRLLSGNPYGEST
jgi:hypothetical protein